MKNDWIIQALRCPLTHARLELVGDEFIAEEGANPRLAYPIREGVPVLIAANAREV